MEAYNGTEFANLNAFETGIFPNNYGNSGDMFGHSKSSSLHKTDLDESFNQNFAGTNSLVSDKVTNRSGGKRSKSAVDASPVILGKSDLQQGGATRHGGKHQGSDHTDLAESQQADQGAAAELHNHAKPASTQQELHISLDAVDGAKGLNSKKMKQRSNLSDQLGKRGDFLDPGAGTNTVIGAGGNDIILGRDGGFNTITTGTGKDMIVLGKETTNRIFDFDPAKDKLALAGDLKPRDLIIAQGTNPGKGGVDQPLDSENNTLIIDKKSGHILAALTFVKSDAVSEKNFVQVKPQALDALAEKKFFNVLEANDAGQQLTGTRGRDKMIGGKGDDFLYLGDDSFRFGTATGTGPGEFPFPNTSPGTSELDLELKGGVLKVNGTYRDFEGVPLFSDGVEAVAPDAVIPNGADPQALIEGFLRVPNDAEGNPISGFHLHFSRENFADATVERYFTVTTVDAQSGQVSAEFELTPELQAALLAKNLYGNLHSAKHPVGENRVEFKTAQFI
jgi:CHRD domain/RTX calcium-binding nonapeptide repeat (4 copies)